MKSPAARVATKMALHVLASYLARSMGIWQYRSGDGAAMLRAKVRAQHQSCS
jgi:hypothetical protein